MIRDLDPTNDLAFLRIKTKNEEILVTPDKDYMLIAVQGPKAQRDKREEENWYPSPLYHYGLYNHFNTATNHNNGNTMIEDGQTLSWVQTIRRTRDRSFK